MSTSVVLLAYEEAENLKVLLPNISQIMQGFEPDFEIIVVDSTKPLDSTKDVCEQYQAKYVNQEEPFYAGAFRTGIRHATKDKIQILDADGSHDPIVIPQLHQKFLEGYDLVIGSRYVKGGKSNDSRFSLLMSKLLNFVMRICIGVKAKDISTGFRLYDAKQLKTVTLQRNNYDVLQEVILKLKLNKASFRIAEVPIIFNKRMFGESKRQLWKFIQGYIVTVFYLLHTRFTKRVRGTGQ